MIYLLGVLSYCLCEESMLTFSNFVYKRFKWFMLSLNVLRYIGNIANIIQRKPFVGQECMYILYSHPMEDSKYLHVGKI